MLIYGTKSVKIASDNAFNIECPNCNKKSTTEVYVFSKHLHLFWIPMFPIGKTGVAQCENCKKVTEKKNMTDGLLDKYNELKSTGKPKIWQFSGLALVAVLIFIGFNTAAEETQKEKELLASPRAGDRYTIRTENGYYTVYKIEQVAGDSIEFLLNVKEINKVTAVKDIDKPENYIGITEKFSRKQVDEMYTKGEIPDIVRN